MKSSKHKKVKASDFDSAFEKGDVTKHLDVKSAKARFPTQRISALIFLKVLLTKLIPSN